MPQVEPLRTNRDGVLYKLCRGPYHRSPKWLPHHKFYRRGNPKHSSKLRAWCKKCEMTHRRFHRFYSVHSKAKTHIVITNYLWMLLELQQRAGVHKAAALVGISVPQFYNLKNGKHVRTRKEHLANAFNALAELRRLQKCTPSEAYERRKKQQVQKWQVSRLKQGRRLTIEVEPATMNGSPTTGGSGR